MLQKPLEESDVKSVSTKMTVPTKAASFTSTAKREMYQQVQSKKTIQQVLHNYLILSPQYISSVNVPYIHMLENGENFVAINDNHYTFVGDRSKLHLISRNSEQNSRLLFTNSKMPGNYVYLQSLEKYDRNEKHYLHANITKYHPFDQESEVKDIHFQIEKNEKFVGFVTLQNSKKGLLLSKVGKKYKLLTIKFKMNNKYKNPEFKKERDMQESERSEKEEEEFIYDNVREAEGSFELDEGETIIKLLNSQFGDSVLIITNFNIYELEFEAKNMFLKGLNMREKIEKFLRESEQPPNEGDEILDVVYVVNGLKILLITKKGYVGIVDTQHIRYFKNLNQIIGQAEKKITIRSIQSLVGRLMILTKENNVIFLKDNETNFAFDKTIHLGLVSGSQVQKYNCKGIPKTDEIFVEMIVKRDSIKLQIFKKTIMSAGNEFSELYTDFYHEIDTQNSPLLIDTSSANGIVCMASGNEIKTLGIFQGLTAESNKIRELFTTSFFEKPIGLSINPFGNNVIVHFKEFVKFFKFEYQNMQQFYTLNIRNTSYAGFTKSGQYIIIGKDDKLFFLNPHMYTTQKVIDMYGDIKSIKFFDILMFVVTRTKSNNKIINIFLENKEEYEKIHEIRYLQTERSYIDENKVIIVSKKHIKTFSISGSEISQLSKQIKFSEENEEPSCVELIEDLGFLMVGTNKGKIYQFLWPFTYQSILQSHCLPVSQNEILKISPSTSREKLYVYSKNKSIFRFKVTQLIEGEEMPNMYAINPKTLYTDTFKYQFVNKEWFYPKFTSYIQEYSRLANETIDELEFIKDKRKDDLDEFKGKHKLKEEKSIQKIKDQFIRDKNSQKRQYSEHQNDAQKKIQVLDEEIKQMEAFYSQKKGNEVEKYESSLLELYRESDRLKNIYESESKKLKKERDDFSIKNGKTQKQFYREQEENVKIFKKRYEKILKHGETFKGEIEQQKIKGQKQLQLYKKLMKDEVEKQLDEAQMKKQSIIGEINYLQHEITNYKKRRDEFDTLIMETSLQIDDLKKDRISYNSKKAYLKQELHQKEEMIEEKQTELVNYVKNTTAMKKTKSIHAFQLTEYEKQIQPVSVKMIQIDERIKKMNGQIMREYSSKIQKQNSINEQTELYKNLKEERERKVKSKLVSQTKFQRFVETLTVILEDPLSKQIRRKLYEVATGEKYEINEEEIFLKNQNTKIMRKKNFIRKEIQENEKREQHATKNKNEYFKHFNQNTLLLREFQDLKQTNMKLQAKKISLQQKIQALRSTQFLTPVKRTRSVLNFQKNSQKMLTPFQKHEIQYNDMFRKNTIETKATNTQGKSLSFLKTLMKDVKKSDSRYEKMQIIRQRVRSYVNPELGMNKTLRAQKLIFDEKQY